MLTLPPHIAEALRQSPFVRAAAAADRRVAIAERLRGLTRRPAIDGTHIARSAGNIDGIRIEAGDRVRIRRSSTNDVPAPAPLEVLCRHIGVEHLGRWVTIPGRPADARVINEPSLIHRGGRLVGYLPDADPARSPSTRVLVLLSGGIERIPVPAGDTVIVAPRDWS